MFAADSLASTPACPSCAAPSEAYVHTRDWNRRRSDECFTYYRCPGCELIFIAPIPEDLGRYYDSEYPAYARPESLIDLERRAANEEYKLRIVQRFVASGRLLEIGPGAGLFAYLARKAGYDVHALEMDPDCCRFLHEVVGVAVTQVTDVVAALSSAGSYDVIALWHVLEHLQDPWSVLREAAVHLNPGGVLVIATPNPASFERGLFGRFWVHLDAPRHLQLIPFRLLEAQLGRLGLRGELVGALDEGSAEFNRFAWWEHSVNNALCALLTVLIGHPPPSARAALRSRDPQPRSRNGSAAIRLPYLFARGVLRLVGAPLVRLLAHVSGRSRGPAYTAVFVRSEASGPNEVIAGRLP